MSILHIPTGIVFTKHIGSNGYYTKQTLEDLFNLDIEKLFSPSYEKNCFIVRRFIDSIEDNKIHECNPEDSYKKDVIYIRKCLNIVEFEVLDD